MSIRNLIQSTVMSTKKPLLLVALEGSNGDSQWRKALKKLIKAPVVSIGLETQELPADLGVGDAGLTIAVMSPKDPFEQGLGAFMQAAASGEPSNLLAGVLDSDGDSKFTETQQGILKPLTQLIADRNGTFVCDNLDTLADETNRRLRQSDFEVVPLKGMVASGQNLDSAMN